MNERLIFFFRRDNEFGFDGFSILAFNKEQASIVLKETVIDPDKWYYSHQIELNKYLSDNDEDEW